MKPKFKIGDLVRVKKSSSLNPVLRFFWNKIGLIASLVSETQRNGEVYMREYKVIFYDGRYAKFKDYELVLVASVDD